jgi:hypothetical protein
MGQKDRSGKPDRRNDMTKLPVAFRNFMDASATFKINMKIE